MPTWVVSLLETAVHLVLANLSQDWAKQVLCNTLRSVDAAVQATDATLTGPFKGVADEVAQAFHAAVVSICQALGK